MPAQSDVLLRQLPLLQRPPFESAAFRPKFVRVGLPILGILFLIGAAMAATERVPDESRQITGLRSIPLVFPPVYRLAYRKPPYVTYFLTESGSTIRIGVWSWQFSKMAKYIRQEALVSR